MKQCAEITENEALKMIFNDLLLKVRTNIPAIIESEPYRFGKFWCVTVIPAINLVKNKEEQTAINPIKNVPLISLCGGNYSITTPIKKGDSVWLSIADRAIDLWQFTAKISNPSEVISLRHHDLTDCVAISGGLSISQLGSYDNDNISLQSNDNSTFIKLNKDFVEIKEKSGALIKIQGNSTTITSSSITLNGNVAINGDITQSGSFTNDSSVTTQSVVTTAVTAASGMIAGKELAGHTHSAGSYTANGANVTGASGENS